MSASFPRILIAGGGVASWTVALALVRAMGPDANVAVIDAPGSDTDESLGPACAALSTLASARDGLKRLGVEEIEVVRAARGGFKLGERLEGWAGLGFIGYGAAGAAIGPVRFHQQIARLRALGETVDVNDHALNALAARSNRFAPPAADPASILSTLDYGLHVETDGLAGLLRAKAIAQGARGIEADVKGAERSSEGGIAAVIGEDGARHAADLFIDATGSRALLIGETLEGAWESWASPFPHLTATLSEDPAPPPPYTSSTASTQGWRRSIPLDGGRYEITASASASGADAQRLDPGFRAEPWRANCVAVGAAACRPDPLASAELALVHSAARRLVGLIPDPRAMAVEAREFNRLSRMEADSARDFAALAYKVNARPGPVWTAAREAETSDSLAARLALFRARGRITRTEQSLYSEDEWTSALLAHGVMARRHDPMADGLDAGQLKARCARIRQMAQAASQSMPGHAETLARIKQSGVRP